MMPALKLSLSTVPYALCSMRLCPMPSALTLNPYIAPLTLPPAPRPPPYQLSVGVGLLTLPLFAWVYKRHWNKRAQQSFDQVRGAR